MKGNRLLQHWLIICLLLAFGTQVYAQHSSPVRMLYQPRENFFTLSGAGGGNMFGLFKSSGAASGILGVDGNLKIGEDVVKKAKNHLKTLELNFKLNPFTNTSLDTFTSMDPRRLTFQDNDFRIMFGARYTLLREREQDPNEKAKTFATAFFDMVIVPYKLDGTGQGTGGMTSFSMDLGGRFGFLRKMGKNGLWGIILNPQVDVLLIAESSQGLTDQTFEQIILGGNAFRTLAATGQAIPKFSRGFVGTGLKIEIPLNDFRLFFDFRKYFKTGSGEGVSGLSDKLLFSFGGIAVGSIFKNKEARNRKKKNK